MVGGWYPCTWEGWVVLVIWMVCFALFMVDIEKNMLSHFFGIFISIAILICICYKKGEKPKWSWGK